MHIVSFYTGEGAYKTFAERLRASCERFGVAHSIEQLPSTGHWQKNTTLKPKFVYDKMLKVKQPVVWCDADCELIEFPELFRNPTHDLMIYNWFADPTSGARLHDPNQLGAAGGVFLLNQTPAAFQFVYQWIEFCKKYPDMIEDQTVNLVYAQARPKGLRSYWLPRSYNRMEKHWPDVPPVINHQFTGGKIFTGEASTPLAPIVQPTDNPPAAPSQPTAR